MKIGIGVEDYSRWGENRYQKLYQHGFSCVNFSMMNTKLFPYGTSLSETEKFLVNERNLAQRYNIEIYQAHGPWNGLQDDLTQKLRDLKLEHIKRSLWATAVLECKNWVIHPLMPFGVDDRGTEKEQKTFDINFEYMHKVLSVAKQYGITVCLENMPFHNFSISTPQEILKFVKEINDDKFKICLDTGHIAAFPELSVAPAMRAIDKELCVFHIHDSFPNNDLHLMPFFGSINWNEFSKALKEINYQGCLCLETAPPSNLPDDIYEDLCISLCKMVKLLTID